MLSRRALLALLVAAFVAGVWLNQGISVGAWKAWEKDHAANVGPIDAVRAPFLVLYRRALDEEMYFAVASAILGRPYDRAVFDLRGDTPLPEVATPADGQVHLPYREVPIEYPPPNLPLLLAPRLVADTFDAYAKLFGALMGALLIGAVVLATRSGATRSGATRSGATRSGATRSGATRSGRDDLSARLFGFSLLLLAHGALAIQRLDALVALLLALIVDAARRDDDRMLGFWTGLVGAAKIVPLAVGVIVVLAKGIRDPRRLFRVGAGTAAGLLVGLGPQLLFAPASFRTFLQYHGARGLQVEASLGVIYGALKAVLGNRERATIDFGSFNFHGPVAGALAKASLLVLIALLAIVGRDVWRSKREPDERIVLAALAATVTLWLGGKVFSPQYLTWALPLVLAIPGRSWRRFAIALGVILVVSQVYYRGYYDQVYKQLPLGVATMVLRLALLVGFLGMILTALRARIGQDKSQSTRYGTPQP